jgi:hypothetical protein
MQEQINEGYRQVAKAVLNRAVKDILKANGHADEARWFLGTEWAEVVADVAGEDIGRYRLWTVHPPHVLTALRRAVKTGEEGAVAATACGCLNIKTSKGHIT